MANEPIDEGRLEIRVQTSEPDNIQGGLFGVAANITIGGAFLGYSCSLSLSAAQGAELLLTRHEEAVAPVLARTPIELSGPSATVTLGLNPINASSPQKYSAMIL